MPNHDFASPKVHVGGIYRVVCREGNLLTITTDDDCWTFINERKVESVSTIA